MNLGAIDDLLQALITVSPSSKMVIGGMAVTHRQRNGMHELRLARTDRYPDTSEVNAMIAVLDRLNVITPRWRMRDEPPEKVVYLSWPEAVQLGLMEHDTDSARIARKEEDADG